MIQIPTSANPLQWPEGFERTRPGLRERARFGRRDRGYSQQLTVHQAIGRLMEEIRAFTRVGHDWRIDPDAVVISCDLRMRQDGLPYSSASEPEDSGVAIYLELDGEPHVFPCDRWDRVADNIAAVAAHLSAMRGIERWGVGDLRRAFAGFAALPPGTGESFGAATPPWWQVLELSGPDVSRHEIVGAHRRLRSRYHPDRATGDAEQFQAVNVAFEQARKGWR